MQYWLHGFGIRSRSLCVEKEQLARAAVEGASLTLSPYWKTRFRDRFDWLMVTTFCNETLIPCPSFTFREDSNLNPVYLKVCLQLLNP